MPDMFTASGVTVPAFGPVSQYLDSRRACVSANTRADPSAVRGEPVGEVEVVEHRRDGAVRVAAEQPAVAARLQHPPLKCWWSTSPSTR